MRFTALWRT